MRPWWCFCLGEPPAHPPRVLNQQLPNPHPQVAAHQAGAAILEQLQLWRNGLLIDLSRERIDLLAQRKRVRPPRALLTLRLPLEPGFVHPPGAAQRLLDSQPSTLCS